MEYHCLSNLSKTQVCTAMLGALMHGMRWVLSPFRPVLSPPLLTHWRRVTHICVGKLTIIGSDNGLLPGRRQAIIWTNAWILLIVLLNNSVIGYTFSSHRLAVELSNIVWKQLLPTVDISVCWFMLSPGITPGLEESLLGPILTRTPFTDFLRH